AAVAADRDVELPGAVGVADDRAAADLEAVAAEPIDVHRQVAGGGDGQVAGQPAAVARSVADEIGLVARGRTAQVHGDGGDAGRREGFAHAVNGGAGVAGDEVVARG